MCQAILGKIIQLKGKEAIVEIKGTKRKINTELVDVKKGDYVLCSLNIAIEKVEPEEAKQMIG
jgi:hydrogenase assembly chaperone HypC/HupF